MSIKCGERFQMSLLPSRIEDYVGPEDRVRAYDAFIDCLLEEGLTLPSDSPLGRPLYDPVSLLKLLVYSYSYGVRSSRQIERNCHHNLSFVWLIGGLKPDHKTIASFRRDNLPLLKGVLKQCARFCLKLGLVDGNILFVDGTKIRANAAINNSWTSERAQRALDNIDERITMLLQDCDRVDQEEQTQQDYVKLSESLQRQNDLKQQVQRILKELKNQPQDCYNTTDPDCATMKGRQGTHAAFNVQHVVDDKHGLIVHQDVVSNATDIRQLPAQTEQTQEILGRAPTTVCADAGYACTEELEKIRDKQIQVIVPSQKQAAHEPPGPFDHDQFRYDPEKDQYTCPAGKTLSYAGINKAGISFSYRIKDPDTCQACPHFGICTTSKQGRKITRLLKEQVKKEIEAQYASPVGQEIYKRRKEKAELPFGFIKKHLKVDSFLLRGRSGALAESSLWASCFNITRLITLLGGVQGFIRQCRAQKNVLVYG